jgi:hypothetical protein
MKNKSGTVSSHKCGSATASENVAKGPPKSIIYNLESTTLFIFYYGINVI